MVVPFEELVYNADAAKDLHLMLNSLGGDGEAAIRLVRSAQERCRKLTVVIPDQAKSAATLIALGAHSLIMGPASDLGPIDPQFPLDGAYVSAKDIIAAVDNATARVQEAPETYPLWASLLANVTALMVQQARSAIDRSSDLLNEALAANVDRSPDEVKELVESLRGTLIDEPHSHAAVFGADDALKAKLPVIKLGGSDDQWRALWRLWTRYAIMRNVAVFEGGQASQVWSLDA
jgi:ClpP class serine protease